MYKRMKNIKKEKGITLVALVVTIIVLLILAFVAISMIMGDNGVVEKAKESKEETIKAQEREFIKLAYQDLEMDYRLKGTDITADRVMEKLSEYDKNIKVEMITKDEIGDTEVVVEKNSGEEYAEIVFTETEHKYAGSLVIDENKARYEVTYNANRGHGGPTKQIKIQGTPLTITLERPERKGYNFIGWARESTAVVAEYMSGSQYTEDANITLYAVWQMRDDIEPVAQIGSTKYPSIQEAIYDCSQEAGEEATTILLLTDTEEEFRTYEGQNIILNLQGHTVTSKSEGALCTNNGKLQIINGELRSEKGTAITNNGEITIGDNSNGINDNTPTIYGNNIGVENNGTFNFYDGKIQGKVPIQGTTPNTPDEYGAVQTTYENGIATVQLRILTGYEARIGWVYYETLQGAIDIAKAKETVTLIKDLQLKEILEVSETKDVTLDLYGYTLTVVADKETVIKNYGDLEITDNSIEQTGNIEITNSNTTYTIENNGNKELILSGGVINTIKSGLCNKDTGNIILKGGVINAGINDSWSSYGICNENTGNIIIEKGKINNYSSHYAYSLYNKKDGNIVIKEGAIITNITENKQYGDRYGIYNIGSGTVIMEGGTIENKGNSREDIFGIYNASNGNINIIEGEINVSNTRGESFAIYNSGIGDIQVKGGTITSNEHGIYNKNTGSIIIEGGTILANGYDSYGIYNKNIGKVIIGSKYNETISSDNPLIIGEYSTTNSTTLFGCGIYNLSGILELYNGKIQGTKTAILGNITQVKEEYIIENKLIENKDTIYLIEKNNEENVVQIENVKYSTLQNAIDSINGNEQKTIKLIKSFELDKSIEFNKNIILDLNGYTITNKYYKLSNKSNLKITDTSENKTGKIDCMNTIIGIINEENGNLEVEAGIINCSGLNYTYGIYNVGIGKVKISGGTINSIDTSKNQSYGYSYGIYNNGSGIIEMIGGEINSDNNIGYYRVYGIYNANNGDIKVEGGNINSDEGIFNQKNGTIIIKGGKINSRRYGINNSNEGIVTVENGTIKGNESGIFNNNNGDVKIIGGIIEGSSNGIYNNSTGKVEVIGGIINSSNNSTYGHSYGIYNQSTGTIIIGAKGDETVSQEEPYIKGEYTGTSSNAGYGIYNTKGKLYFYDGKIEGTIKAVFDIITEIEKNTYLNYNSDETILTLSKEKLPIAQIEDVIYTDLQEAIDSLGEDKKTIKILRNINYTIEDSVITISDSQNIILDLNGYKISSAIPTKVIENNGFLEIIDTSEGQTGLIITSEEKTIHNVSKGKLVLTGGTIENRGKYSIYNEGELNINKGTIIGNSDKSYGIYNYNKGIVTVSGGIISGDYGIYNSMGEVYVNGGVIDCKNSKSMGVYGIYNENGYILVNDGIINTYNSSNSSGVVGSYGSYGIYNKNEGTIEILKGTIESRGYGWPSYCIYNYNTGKLKIGNKDSVISKDEITLISNNKHGATTCIYNANGILQFYDGTIKGSKSAISGNISDIENATEMNIEREIINNITYNVITLKPEVRNVAVVNDIEYDSISKAVEACGTTESTIEILRDTNPGATIIIRENQNITIDLKGYTINNYTGLQNEGILKIIDTSSEQTGKIIGVKGTALSNTGTLELQGGTITDSGYGIKNTGTVIVNGGNIVNNTYGIYNGSNVEENEFNRIVDIEKGTLSSNKYGIYNYNGTTNIQGGTITSNEYGIYNSNGTTNISSKGISNNTYGVYVASGTTTIKEGTEIQSETGAYAAGGTLNIGESGTMNPDTPIIIGETYGLTVASTGMVYMYDGQVKGKEGATEGYITYTEEGYTVANRTEGEYKIDYLALSGTANAVAEVNGISYANLQSAINSITGGEEQTITLLNGITNSETYTIAEGQKIKLDMNGKTISSDAETTIINNGELTIVDTSNKNVAKITSTTGVAIQNIGTLTLGEDEGTVNGDVITIEGEIKGIENTGTLNIYDGTIIGITAIEGEVNKTPSGYTITTTTVDGKQKATLTK